MNLFNSESWDGGYYDAIWKDFKKNYFEEEIGLLDTSNCCRREGKQRVDYFLTAIGPGAREEYEKLNFDKAEDKNDLLKVIEKFNQNCKPVATIIGQRLENQKFTECKQEVGESFKDKSEDPEDQLVKELVEGLRNETKTSLGNMIHIREIECDPMALQALVQEAKNIQKTQGEELKVKLLKKRDQLKAEKQTKAKNMDIKEKQANLKDVELKGANSKHEKETMSSRPKYMLTENGIINLFEPSKKTNTSVQVIFLVCTDMVCYLRVSDGKNVSPVVLMVKKQYSPVFGVGAVITVKEVRLAPNDLRESKGFSLKDAGLHPFLIHSYNLVDDSNTVGTVIGNLNNSASYKDALKIVAPQLKKYNPDFATYVRLDAATTKTLQEDSDVLRKRGNVFYNKHNYNDAIDHYEMAKEKNPYDHRTWANRSQAYYNCSDFVQAEQDAILAIKMNPFYEKAYYWASKAALEQSKFKEAEVYAECGLFLCSSKVKIEYNKELQDLLAVAKSKASNSSFCGFEKSLSAKAGIAHCVASVSASVSSNANEKGINGSFSISLFGNVNGNTDKEKKDLKGNEKKGKQMRPKKAQNHQVEGIDEYCSACSDDDDYDGLKKSSEEEKKRNKTNERSCKNGIVPRNLEKDKQQNKEVLGTTEPEKEAKPEDIYQDAMRTGKRFYELGEYRQAMEAFGKGEAHLEAYAKKSDGFRKLAKNGKAEGQVIQFIVGMCKIHFGKSFILDGMEIMKGLTERGSIFPSRPAAHYWLCFGYEKIFLFKLAYDHAIACGEAIKENPDFRPIKWPGTNENIRETVPDTLKAEHKAALNKNMDSMAVPEEDALRMWNSLNVSGLTKRLENIQEFYEKQKLAERLIYFQICRSSQDVSKLSRGDLSFNKSLCNGNILEKESSVKSILKAKCRYKKCLPTQGHKFATEEIYLTDPDFKGYLDIFCEDSCTVSYHPCCWKAFKEDSESRYGRMADKEFLGTDCITPDCSGKICTIHIYDETGKRKNELAKDKKEKKNAPLIKQKKKKDKKKEKPQATKTADVRDKRKSKHDSISEDTTTTPTEEPSIKKDIVEDAARGSDKERLMAAANLPIDPDSLDSSQITILKPVFEVESAPTKNAKKKKKTKKSKVTTMPELLGDPLEAETAVQNEYLNRLRVLRQQRDAQEGVNAAQPQASVTSESSEYMPIPKVLEWLDPANPFYLPHHLRDNPSELETILQTKMIASTSPDLQQSTIVTLLDFMYEWLKSEGPMSVNDARLREYVTENFPPEAQTHVNSCGGIKPFLMQSINFAMIDDIICVRDHVVLAQEMILRTVTDRMNSSKFLISDGRKAKKFTHLLEDTKSTCSSASASSTSLLAGSSVSHTSTLSTNKAQKEEVNNKKAVDIHHNISSSNSHTDSELSADHKLNPFAPSFEDKTHNGEKKRTLSCSVTSGNYEVTDDPADNADELYASDEEEMDEEEEEEIQESDAIEELYARIRELEVSVSQEQEQNQLLSDKLVQIKSQSSLEISTLRREIDDHKEREKVLEAEKLNMMTLRENDAKKVKSDMSRIQDEMKMYQNRNQSLEVAYERSNDRFNELNAKVAEEQELNAQLKEEVKNLQESLTSSSRRAHEAEVKYLSIKKDLGEAYLVKTIDRLLEETARMRQLLPFATEDTIPDRATLSRSIIAWDENIKGLRDRKGAFMEEGARLLGMVNQGRPLNALPPGDLEVPTVPDISVAPLLCLGQRGVSTSKSATPVPDSCQERGLVSSSASSQLPPVTSVGLLSLGPTIGGPQLGVTAAELEANPLFVRNGATAAAFNSGGAIPKGGIVKGPIPKAVHPTATTTQPTTPPASESPIGKKWPDSHQIFVGQIPWDYGETELKNLFSSLFGEVVSVIIHDKGRTAEGKQVPKFGFVTFRNAEDCAKVLTGPAVSINKHTLNIQRKESKKTTKPTTAAVVSLSGNISDPVSISSSQSAYGLSDISLNASAEASKSTVRSLNTPTLNPPSTPTVTKPKFQNLTSSSSVGAIGTLPPKLVRPQPRLPVVSNPKGVNQNVASKEDNVVTSASYKRLIETCKQRLGKEYASHEICAALKEVRHRNNNSLSGLNVDMIVERVKAQMPSRRPGSGQASVAPWAGITQGSVPGGVGPEWQGPAGEEGGPPIEEQCSICLDLLASSPTVPLQCQHVFHEKCIKDWLKRQSNCPNCRTFALMTDEYPSLTHA